MLRSLPTRLQRRLTRPPAQPFPTPVRVVCLTESRFGVAGAIPATRARFEIHRRHAWGHDVRAYPTTDREGTPLTVVYVRVAYPEDPGLEVLVNVFEFPADIEAPTSL